MEDVDVLPTDVIGSLTSLRVGADELRRVRSSLTSRVSSLINKKIYIIKGGKLGEDVFVPAFSKQE